MSDPIKWTDDQQRAIDFPADRSACVSAAAGSGKTALLIERVVSLIKGSDAREPIPADKLAILTFTRNAAEEFRTRMTAAIENASRSGTVQREQLIKFRSSVITTINSFCLGILKEHTEMFDLPVNVTILDDSKGGIMLEKALEKTMEYFYGEQFAEDFPEMYRGFLGNSDITDFSEEEISQLGNKARDQLYKSFSFSSDKALREAIKNIFYKTASFSNSSEWLKNAAEVYGSVSRMEEVFLPKIIEKIRNQFATLMSDISMEKDIYSSIENEEIQEVFRNCFFNDNATVCAMLNSFNGFFPEDCGDTSDGNSRDSSEKNLTPLGKMELLFNILLSQEFKRFSGNRDVSDEPVYQDSKKQFEEIRKRMRERRLEIIEMCSLLRSEAERQLSQQHLAVSALVILVQLLTENYSQMKSAAGVVDFSDCEIKLYNKLREEGCPLCDELAARYQCIIVDEFQDTNDLQYEIFRLISGNEDNLFFVGDIKQSIYAFRGGNPKIMAGCCENEKYRTLPLNQNFRSREEVISTVNCMFDGVMTKRYGDVDYSDNNGLELGASFPPQEKEDYGYFSELHLLDLKGSDDAGSSTSAAQNTPDGAISSATDLNGSEEDNRYDPKDTNAVYEARYTAQLISRMVHDKFMVKKDKQTLRPCSWGDFAILMRSKIHFQDFKSELEKLGIPVSSNGGSYLSADEINLILNYLKVIDNPHLDEELLTVLMSPLYNLTAEDLALARLGILGYDQRKLEDSGIDLTPLFENRSSWSLFSCIGYAASDEEDPQRSDHDNKSPSDDTAGAEISPEKEDIFIEEKIAEKIELNKLDKTDGADLEKKDHGYESVLKQLNRAGLTRRANEKCRKFIEHFKQFQRYASNNSIERLIRRIYDDTDFFSVISTYERGEKKLANIRLLLKYTADFESGGGGTLNDFLRYTDAVKENSGNLEEAVVPKEAEDAVQLLSFHASKGLQWKIVILAGLGTQKKSENGSMIIDREVGIGLKYTDIKTRIRTDTIGYNGALASAELAQVGDELRLLYVAMTRAEEKLIMIGQMTAKSADSCCVGSYSPEFVLSGGIPLKWIVRSLVRHRPDLSVCSLPNSITLEKPKLLLKKVFGRLPDPEKIPDDIRETLDNDRSSSGSASTNEGLSEETVRSIAACAEEISRKVNADYPYKYETALKSRFSVTEIAHRNFDKEKAPWNSVLPRPSFLPITKTNKSGFSGALVGNTYHHIMELIPTDTLSKLTEYEDIFAHVEVEIALLAEEHKLTNEECEVVDAMSRTLAENVSAFFCSKLGQDMLHAELLEREYEVFAELPCGIALNDNSAPATVTTIIQGRVDMLYIKNRRMVVVDYKSDSSSGLKKELESYMEQLQLYKSILPQFLKGFDSIEMYIYSFGQQKAINVEEQSRMNDTKSKST